MKNYIFYDQRYLLVVNNYSLGAIIALLERLNLLIQAENGMENELSSHGFFYENRPASFDSTEKVFRYWLEVPVIEIFEILLKFCKKGINGLDYNNLSTEIIHLKPKEEEGIGREEEVQFKDFYGIQDSSDFPGLTLKQWNSAFSGVIGLVYQRIALYIPDFHFRLAKLHVQDEIRFRVDDTFLGSI